MIPLLLFIGSLYLIRCIAVVIVAAVLVRYVKEDDK